MLGGRKVTRYTDILARAIGAFIVGLTAYALVKQGLVRYPLRSFHTPILVIPHLPFYMVLAVIHGGLRGGAGA